jgi:hypothetical protein
VSRSCCGAGVKLVSSWRVEWTWLAAVCGCVARATEPDPAEGQATSTGSTSVDAPTTSTSESATSSSAGQDETTSSTMPDVGVAIDCVARNESYECAPMDCDAPTNGYECGSLWMDDDGCMRPFCKSNTDCAKDTICFKYGECEPDTIYCWAFAGCFESDGECHCGAVAGCPREQTPLEAQNGTCIPAALRPC